MVELDIGNITALLIEIIRNTQIQVRIVILNLLQKNKRNKKNLIKIKKENIQVQVQKMINPIHQIRNRKRN